MGLSWFLILAPSSGTRSRTVCHDGPQGHLLTISEPHVHSEVNTVFNAIHGGRKLEVISLTDEFAMTNVKELIQI